MNRAVVGIGSNIDPRENIERAIEAVAREHELRKVSSLVFTKPIGYADQPDFLNGALLVETPLTREAFVASLRAVEDSLGRVRGDNPNGPRTIDLDLAVWNGEIVDDDIHARDFLRAAVLEVWPNLGI